LVEVGKADKEERKKKKNEFVIFIFRFHSNCDNVSGRTELLQNVKTFLKKKRNNKKKMCEQYDGYKLIFN
jgi:hypothetical protein